MKKLSFILLTVLVAFQASAQIKTFSLVPSCPQIRSTADSVNVVAQLLASDGVRAITWTQIAGPTVKLPVAMVNSDSKTINSGFTLKGLPVGTYVFQATGLSATGVTGSVNDSVQIIQAPRRIAYTMTVYTDSVRIINQ